MGSIHPEWRAAGKRLVVGTSATAGPLFAVFGTLSTFNVLPSPLGLTWLIAVCGTSLVGGLFVTLYSAVRRHIATLNSVPSSPDEDTVIVDLLTRLFAERRHGEVVAIGATLSRMLWTQGRWRTRMRIGRLLEASAFAEHNFNVYLHALVDMIGWSSVVMGDTVTGERYFRRAAEFCKKNMSKLENGEYYLAKAYRHLGGIAYKTGKYIEAEKWLNEAEMVAEQIGEGNEKRKMEMISGIEYGRAEILRRQHLYEQAEEHSLKAEQIYNDLPDEVRKIKVLVQRGMIHLGQNDLPQAYSWFAQALELAKINSRKEQLADANRGLGLYCLVEMQTLDEGEKQRKQEEARYYLQEAKNLYGELGMVAEQEQVATELQRAMQNRLMGDSDGKGISRRQLKKPNSSEEPPHGRKI